jgi:hypothetical protein
MKKTLVVLATVMVLGVSTMAYGINVWPQGTNPKTMAPVNGFCDCFQAILDNSLLGLLGSEYTVFFSYLTPGVGDVNGTAYLRLDPLEFGLGGNGLLDCDLEMKLIEEVLRDTNFNVNGLTHAMVYSAWTANDARFAADVGSYWSLLGALVNGLPQLLKGYMIIGDGHAEVSEGGNLINIIPDPQYGGSSAGFIQAIIGLLADFVVNPNLDLNTYSRMPQYFSKLGDADGDGASNWCEYNIYGPTQAAYVAAALYNNPPQTPTPEQCGAVVFHFTETPLGGWFEVGDALSLRCAVLGATGNVGFQWSKNGTPIGGATSATYAIASLALTDSGTYKIVATDQSKASIEATAVVNVYPEGSLPAANYVSLAVLLGILVGLGGLAIVIRRSRVKA